MRSLVVARVGRRSLHASWLVGSEARDWDLLLVPYEPIGQQAGLDCRQSHVIAGPKWLGLRRLLNEWDGWRAYDFVWMPDDDIRADAGTITRMFAAAAGAGLDLFAPALHPSSYWAHFDTMQNPRFFGRRVGFVEIMAPAFSRRALERLLPTLDLTATGWGWGLDSVWPKLLGHENVGIIDATPVLHTRPVGQMRDGDLARRVAAESAALLERYDCRQVHATFGAFGEDFAPVELGEEGLRHELRAGWDYLVEREPEVARWIDAYQRDPFGRHPYPTAGTPAAGAPVPVSAAA